MKGRLLPFVTVTVILFLFILYVLRDAQDAWQGLPQYIGRKEPTGDGDEIDGDSSIANVLLKDPDYANWNPKPNLKPGSRMPASHNYTSTLVVAKTKDEKTDWMDKAFPNIQKDIYIADDPTAPLHPPKNKGHEVMIYLSWIIDNYDDLPDVAIFMHAHQFTWHNDDMLGHNAANLIKRLSRQRVWREGFVNMRCSWHPGCPDWMHPGETESNAYKQEEVLLSKSWSELFPLDKVPSVLAQPCCAQFALSRERIQAKPHAQYIWYREWLFSTKLPDHLSGRIWEYVWQFVFTGNTVHCPKENVCFCDQYGTCFGGEAKWDGYLKMRDELRDRERDLREWQDKGNAIARAKDDGKFEEAEKMERPESGKNEKFLKEIHRLRPMVDNLRKEAEERGKDPRSRAKEAGREWHDGDDF